MAIVTTAAKCDARATGRTATEWGFTSLPCNATRGLASFVDRQGTTRYVCPARGHRENVERRYGVMETLEPCFFCGRLDPILQGIYSRVTLGTGVVNLCDHCRSKGDEQDEEPEREYDLNPEGDPTLNGAFG